MECELTQTDAGALLAKLPEGKHDFDLMRRTFPDPNGLSRLVTTLGPSLENAMIAIGIRRVPVFVRVVRAGALQLRSSEFVLATWALGANPLRVSTRHVL